ncbi:endonuclease/exonuclease/phosphatase family protein [Halobacillus naozhouensis]|uniref:Endonuclease/exonuclease/phosphatase family protein n=1 Tax=Halobacillus naozhouensis TaxID=554880 RepID=A0ABY8J3U8_9BACI|nr:endonuclease/exonuclease/phosphatase family protein [Halobacillus naozhouensis]WFT75626.1 endonuclease/exonuclease/phosphatase family protein [Halobacillus naozhouensis]
MRKVWNVFMLLPVLFLMVGSLLSSPLEAFASEKSSQAAETELRVMTFNLRYLNDSDPSPHTWEERRPTVRQVIRKEQPDIIGTQEAVYQQVRQVGTDLSNYKWIGLGREGGSKGEFMAVYYNENRFTPLEYDHYWLSDTPHIVGSTSWGNTIPRMVTWVKFHDTKTDQSFYFVNTHFDHISEEAREKSAALINEKVKEFGSELPVILTGDFNASPDSKPHEILTKEGPFVDTWTAADIRINEHLGTFNGFNDPTGGGPDKRIDWILSTENVTTQSTEIVNYRKNGQYPSDHYPVISDLTLQY